MTREEEKYTTLDTKQCTWWVNHLFNMAKEKACNIHNFYDAQEIQSAQDKIIKALEQEPVVHGKWERGYSFPDGEYVKCTVCGEIIKCIYPMHFCPNCGSDMRGRI